MIQFRCISGEPSTILKSWLHNLFDTTINILDRIIFAILLIATLFIGLENFRLIIYADIFAKLMGVIIACYISRDLLISNPHQVAFPYREIIDNIKIGINLMLSNVASMLIIGIIRFGIESNWNVSTFGKISLSLSISNLMMIFINALGIVIFPLLKRTDPTKLSIIYQKIRNVLMVTMAIFLLGYYPLVLILQKWLPNYQESLEYLVVVFPISLLEGKMALLIIHI